MRMVLHWLINAVALLALPYVFSSIHVDSFSTALIVAVVLGLINTLIRPLIVILSRCRSRSSPSASSSS